MPSLFTQLPHDWLGTRLFLSNYTQSGAREPRPELIVTSNGTSLELYEPKKKARKTVLVIYGMSPLGEEDPRLIRFIRGCNATGLRVAVPILHGLKSFVLEREDLSAVRECIKLLLNRFSEPFCIVAFSTGASLALTLSAEADLAQRISLITLFSPIYDLREVWKRIDVLARTPIHDLYNADNEIWIRYITAYRNYKLLGYTEAERESIKDRLRRYTNGLSTEEKISFYQNVIATHTLDRHKLLMEEDAFDLLSPRGKLSNSKARVIIIHDASDFLVPPAQAEAMASELSQRTPPNISMIITPVLSHVTIGNPRRITDLARIIRLFGELYA